MKCLVELKSCKLPVGAYAIFGSGPMAIRGIRENRDIDIIVTPELWENLSKTFPKCELETGLKLSENIEAWISWVGFSTEELVALIEQAEVFDGFPFVPLEYVIHYKSIQGREKDIEDITLIRHYLDKNP
jgi:hypothetical protein